MSRCTIIRPVRNHAMLKQSVDTRMYQLNRQLVELPLTIHHDIDGLFDLMTDQYEDWNLYCIENTYGKNIESTLHIDLGRPHIDLMDIRYLISPQFSTVRKTWLILLMQGCRAPIIGQKTVDSRITADYYVKCHVKLKSHTDEGNQLHF